MAKVRKIRGDFHFNDYTRRFLIFRMQHPKRVANDVKNHFLRGFRKGGGQTDAGRWPRRKRTARGDRGKKPRALLVQSGRLRRSIRVMQANWYGIRVGTSGIPYAPVHNYGLGNMPQREFIGPSRKLEKKLKRGIKKKMDRVMR